MHFRESRTSSKTFHLENSKTTMLLLLLIMNFVPENGKKKAFLQQKTWNTNYIFLTVMTHVSAVVTMLNLIKRRNNWNELIIYFFLFENLVLPDPSLKIDGIHVWYLLDRRRHGGGRPPGLAVHYPHASSVRTSSQDVILAFRTKKMT